MEDPADLFRAGLPDQLRGGDATAVSCVLTGVHLTDGSRLTLSAPGVTAVVGPNNAGKSTLLRELHTGIRLTDYQTPGPARVVDSFRLQVRGTHADALAWLIEHARVGRSPGRPDELGLMPFEAGEHLTRQWASNGMLLNWKAAATMGRLGFQLRPFFVLR